jgi:hypothetical protein
MCKIDPRFEIRDSSSTRKIQNIAIAFLIFAAGAGIGASEQSAKRRGPVIRQVDHILVKSGDPEALFRFFTETLQLPTAWPLSKQPGFVSGGVGAGNVNLELFRYADPKGEKRRGAARASFSGLAFEPYPLAGVLSELQVRGIPYNAPESHYSTLPNGSQGLAWTMLTLPSFSNDGYSVFLYEYSPAFLQVEVRRRQLGNRLVLNSGGPLGFQSVSEIVISSVDPVKARADWTRLLGNPNPDGSWHAGAGPSIRLVQGTEDRIQKIVCKVQSLDRARIFLKKNALLGSGTGKGIAIVRSHIQQLRINLAENQ